MALTPIHEVKEVIFGWTEGFHAKTRREGIIVEWPEGAESASDHMATANTATVVESTQGLASLIGKYNNDPSWDDFPAFLEQYRREIDEINR